MTLKLESHRDVQIYVDTLYSLARDARVAGDNAALKFIGAYLVNVVPPNVLETFREELKRIEVIGTPPAIRRGREELKLDDSPVTTDSSTFVKPSAPAPVLYPNGSPIAPARKVRQTAAATNW